MTELILNPPNIDNKIKWSPSRLETKLTCNRKYYFQYIKKPKPKVPIPHYFVKGKFMHKRIEKFYNKNGKLWRKSPETFAKSAGIIFTRYHINTGEMQGQEIDWGDKNRYIIREQIKGICREIYDQLIQDGPPIINPEYEFNFLLNGRWFTGKFDSILKNMIIRDFKTTNKAPSSLILNNMYQFTFYALAFCCYCHADENFREAVGITETEVEEWGGNPIFISDKVTIEYFKLHYFKDKEKDIEEIPQIFRTKRNNNHYFELCDLIDEQTKRVHEMTETSTYIPNRGNHCNFCEYEKPCNEMGYDIQPNLDKSGQLYLFTHFMPSLKTEKGRQKSFRFKR